MDSTDNDYYINSGNVVVSNQASSNIMTAEIKGMIQELDDNIKVPFMMYYAGYKYQEISDYLELPWVLLRVEYFLLEKN